MGARFVSTTAVRVAGVAGARPRHGVKGLLAAAALVAAGAGATSAEAALSGGSGAVMTFRDCPAATGSCFGAPVARSEPGGPNGGGSGVLDNGAGSRAQVQMGFAANDLPLLKVLVESSDTQRVGANAFAFREFTWEGDYAIDLGLELNFHYLTTGSGLSTGGDPADEVPGDASGTVALYVNSPSAFAHLDGGSSALEIFNTFRSLAGADCLGAGFANSYGTTGETTVTAAASGGCGSGGRLTINPGQTFVVSAFMQAVANRGGELDALHTLDVHFDLENTFVAGTNTRVDAAAFTADLQAAAIPEPATWALLIGGFGAAGSLLRRRSAVIRHGA